MRRTCEGARVRTKRVRANTREAAGIRRPGQDVTLVTYGGTLSTVIDFAGGLFFLYLVLRKGAR